MRAGGTDACNSIRKVGDETIAHKREPTNAPAYSLQHSQHRPNMAPSLKKALKAFIEGIPASKLEKFPSAPGTLYNDDDFRLDLQGVSSVLTYKTLLTYSYTP